MTSVPLSSIHFINENGRTRVPIISIEERTTGPVIISNMKIFVRIDGTTLVIMMPKITGYKYNKYEIGNTTFSVRTDSFDRITQFKSVSAGGADSVTLSPPSINGESYKGMTFTNIDHLRIPSYDDSTIESKLNTVWSVTGRKLCITQINVSGCMQFTSIETITTSPQISFRALVPNSELIVHKKFADLLRVEINTDNSSADRDRIAMNCNNRNINLLRCHSDGTNSETGLTIVQSVTTLSDGTAIQFVIWDPTDTPGPTVKYKECVGTSDESLINIIRRKAKNVWTKVKSFKLLVPATSEFDLIDSKILHKSSPTLQEIIVY